MTHSRPVPVVSAKVLTMPDAPKTEIVEKVLARQAIVNPFNARAAAAFPGVDFFASAPGSGGVECYSKSDTKGVRHFHLLRYDCRQTIAGRPCQFFVSQCTGCTGYSRGGCRHANALTGIYNHFLLSQDFRGGGRLLAARPSSRACPQCPPPDKDTVTVWRVIVETRGGVLKHDVCIALRDGTACQYGTEG